MSVVTPDFSTTAAHAIGQQLADSAASAAGSFVVGQLLSAVGLNTDPSTQILSELGTILAGIQDLERDVAGLKSDIDAQLFQIEYDVLINRISTFTDLNASLHGLFSDFADATTKDELATKKSLIMKTLDGTITGAPAAWAGVLGSGAASGSGNLIEAFSKIAHQHYTFYGIDAVNAVGTHWAWLDAQQAQSIMYCVEWLNDNGDPQGALRTLKQWQVDRTAQLALLRGMPYDTDSFTYTGPGDDDKSSVTVTTHVPIFPAQVMITDISGGPMMYDLVLRGPVRRGGAPNLSDFNTSYNQVAQFAGEYAGFPTQDASTDVSTSWNVPYEGTLVEFLRKIGGNVANGGADWFADALRNNGFTCPQGEVMLWTDVNRTPDGSPVPYDSAVGSVPYRSIFVDGSGWWNPSTNADDQAYLLFQRRLNDGETNTYWYS